jgi:hypothetical protein
MDRWSNLATHKSTASTASTKSIKPRPNPAQSSLIKPNRAIFMKQSPGKTPHSTFQHFRISAFQRLPFEIALANGAGELKLAGL